MKGLRPYRFSGTCLNLLAQIGFQIQNLIYSLVSPSIVARLSKRRAVSFYGSVNRQLLYALLWMKLKLGSSQETGKKIAELELRKGKRRRNSPRNVRAEFW